MRGVKIKLIVFAAGYETFAQLTSQCLPTHLSVHMGVVTYGLTVIFKSQLNENFLPFFICSVSAKLTLRTPQFRI
jgi:hypothetical protein